MRTKTKVIACATIGAVAVVGIVAAMPDAWLLVQRQLVIERQEVVPAKGPATWGNMSPSVMDRYMRFGRADPKR
jgi:hypothetical protein